MAVKRVTLKRPQADPSRIRRWHTLDEPHAELFSLVRRLEQEQAGRRASLAELRHLYETGGARTGRDYRAGKVGISINVVRSIVGSVSARIGKNRPRPMFLTSNGNWQQQRRARKLTTYVSGAFHHADTYPAMQRAFKDALIGDLGAVRFYAEDSAIQSERVLPYELFVDQREARYGKPRTLHHKRIMDRDALIEMFPDYEAAIDGAPSASSKVLLDSRLIDNAVTSNVDAIEVLESWRLPSADDADDGVHTICIENTTLLREVYRHSRFPFVFLRWDEPDEGFFGTGIAAEIKGIQYEIARILRTIQVAQSRMAAGRIWIPRSAQVDPATITNEPGSAATYAGSKPPHTEIAPSVHPEMYSHLDRLERKAYEQTGASQMSAQSKKPGGVTAAVAIQTLQDVETERFVLQGQRYEQAFMEAAEIVVMLSRDLYENGDVEIRAPGRKFVETIKWSDVDMRADQYVIDIFPTSQLPNDPAGRLDYVSALESKGLIDREQSMSLINLPDIERFTSTMIAPFDEIEAMLDRMLDKGEPVVPEPYMNLKLCLKMAQGTFSRAKANDELPEDRLQLLRDFMDNTEAMINVGNSNADAGSAPIDPASGGPAGPAPGGPGDPGAGGLPPGIPAGIAA